jgi:hypothetical protein
LRGWYFVNLFAVDRDSHALGGFVDIDHQSARAAWPSANSATVAAVNVAMQWLIRIDETPATISGPNNL